METYSQLNHTFRRRHWLNANDRPFLTSHWRKWLCDRGSLTEALIRASDNRFSVRLIAQTKSYPTYDEALTLKISPQQKVLIREVELLGKHQAWVYARSVVPLSTLKHCHQSLEQLGNRSLGTLLFTDPGIRRGALEVCQLSAKHQNYPSRRSIFWIKQQPLLVTEIFLPPMAQISHPS
ncbi:chorismate lyase [Nitrincola tibetensis]|uniref:Probable chorismate pyruvate-lyase n=1 Tax=Nitrincola tibetensis TaxID=2219697 RepID=A0A364NM05_9GAMM|nr:chorismate lyase [Nitrincola tibetensis]RAU18091.1 chorismate lyase [Nitrincola tibetensis]